MAMSNILGELKEIAVDIGLEIERHNKALNSLDDDVEELTIRVKGANQYKHLYASSSCYQKFLTSLYKYMVYL
ncbi:SNAP25 homologous protein SNAP33-like protein [Tanacetum coccineum]